jgi:hypothetical protein
MRRVWFGIAVFCSAMVMIGCVSTTLRLPASFKPKYNSKVVISLKSAALNGVLFQVSDSVFRDVPGKQIEHCRKSEAPNWSTEFISFLDLMDHNPQYYNKFYIVDFKRGDKAKAEITKDIDGLSYLNITYAKRESREKITMSTNLPCADSNSDYIDKDLVSTFIDWPSADEINTVLKEAPNKPKIERFQFNTDFLVFLAERQTILKINPEVAFERSYHGDYLLSTWLEKMSQEIKDPGADLDFINYWLKEISSRSNQAKVIQFFGLHPESAASYGVQVDTAGKLTRKLNSYQEPTYLFMSYQEKDGEYIYPTLKDLNVCLQNLLGTYRNPMSMGMTYESDEDSFLAPGYSRKLAGEE